MSTLQVKDGNGDIKYLKMGGAGTALDPYVPIQDVNIQDQTSAIINLPLHRTGASSTLAVDASVGDTDITVTDGTGFTIASAILLYNVAAERWTPFIIVNVVANVITLDGPLDFAYLAGDTVEEGSHNLAVDGSVTPVVFHIREGDPGLTISGDITRILFSFETATTPTYGDFGDGLTLPNGILLRKKLANGEYQNIANIKDNSDLASICYDMDILSGVGVDGLKARLTFAGQNKLGVTVRIGPNEDLEVVVQDDLTTRANHIHIQAQGHVVVN